MSLTWHRDTFAFQNINWKYESSKLTTHTHGAQGGCGSNNQPSDSWEKTAPIFILSAFRTVSGCFEIPAYNISDRSSYCWNLTVHFNTLSLNETNRLNNWNQYQRHYFTLYHIPSGSHITWLTLFIQRTCQFTSRPEFCLHRTSSAVHLYKRIRVT